MGKSKNSVNKINHHLFKPCYRNDQYRQDEFLRDFEYYETTPLKDIVFDDNHLIPWVFFNKGAIISLLPNLIEGIYKSFPVVIASGISFIQNFIQDETIQEAFADLPLEKKLEIKKLFEFLLFSNNPELSDLWSLEDVLFQNLEFVTTELENS